MIFGVTGHQHIASASLWTWVRQSFRSVLESYPSQAHELFTSLAAGADQALASEALDAGVKIVVVVPCSDYEKTFAVKDDLDNYRYLLQCAARINLRDFPEPSEEAYFAAGRHIVDSVNMMVAVWNGRPAAGRGGTGDIVEYAIRRKKPITHINPETQQVSRL